MTLNVRDVNQEKLLKVLGEASDSSSTNSIVGILKRLHSSSSVNGETINDLIDEIDDLKTTKADKIDTYTKTQVDDALALKADENDVYTIQQINSALSSKADKSTTYTIQQVDSALSSKANQSTTYTKTETDTLLSQKADKTDTYTKTQVDNLITGSAITNYVTTDTLQTITGTKMCNEIHSNSFYTPDLVLNTKHFTTTLTNGTTDQDDKTLCSYAYINSMISQNNQDYKQIIMNICYPVNSIFLSWINYELGSNGKPIITSGTPLDYGVWQRLNDFIDTGSDRCVLGLVGTTSTLGGATGSKILELRHIPDHAHQGIITYDGKKYSGSGSAAIPADDPDGDTPRTNWRCSTTNNVGTAHSTYFSPRGAVQPFYPYGLYFFAYRKQLL